MKLALLGTRKQGYHRKITVFNLHIMTPKDGLFSHLKLSLIRIVSEISKRLLKCHITSKKCQS